MLQKNKIFLFIFFLLLHLNSLSQENKVVRGYFKDSIVSIESWFGDDNKLDSLKTYYLSGNKKEIFYYNNDEKIHGNCFQFNDKNKKIVTWEFKNGKLVNRNDFALEFNQKNKKKVRNNINTLKGINKRTEFNPKTLKDFYIRAVARKRLGNTFLALQDFQNAERFIHRKSVREKVSPKLKSDLYSQLGAIFAEFENEDLAIHYKLKAIDQFPENYTYKYNLGAYLFQIKSYRLAITYFNKVKEKWKKHAFSNWILGAIYSDFQDYEKALEFINLAFEKEANLNKFGDGKAELDIRTIRGFILHKLNRTDEGITDLEEALKINKENSYANKNLGVIYNELGEFEKSLKYLNKAKELNYTQKYDSNDLNYYLENSINYTIAKPLPSLADLPYLSPNPVSTNFTIKNYSSDHFRYKILDYNTNVIQQGVSKKVDFNISELPKGLYTFITLDNKTQVKNTFKIIKN
ncbi:hypothetical protein JL193_04970 [Polaribacter batillariae]|uniref:Secretion system C-terminal sorting domain-containing protein n=1 Tax=Polaribacter batillariae TaxID=2808900 RepID=A0ABX7SYN6_9FLAO|nr:tetratricopeptide repeat protein [Polaribacter batillariae]QTD38631.1 hypothetical protein JL193_04970 [Polaribacter batillariae]